MKQLNNNEAAIVFTAQDYLGKEINLSDYRGQKILLVFLRGTDCPFCLARIKKMVKMNEQLKSAGVQVIVIVAARKEAIQKNSKKNSAPFPILADPTQEIFEKYGLYNSKFVIMKTMLKPLKMMWTMMTNRLSLAMMKEASILPGEFLIDGDFQIQIAYYGKHFCDYLSFDEILGKS